ncbi:hypothetical protein [Listeria booriae]|uniref:hypothetical protein n=1 Tax=Listeria booriae TaxID=1552123 RepID=UPI001624FAFE|nr:hypothetical protein [Listeria booriae]MBC1513747.1 hypothetical protein [Listeria booriae]MBC6152740.1 hypothetical protein [Listeria booriae]
MVEYNLNGMKIYIDEADSNDKVYVSLSFGSGYSTRFIRVKEEKIFIGAATAKLIANYKKNVIKEKLGIGIKTLCSMNATTFYWSVDKDEVSLQSMKIIKEVLNFETNKELFQNVKTETMKSFANNYKDVAFRSEFKIFEKGYEDTGYNLNLLCMDLQQIDQKKIELGIKYLFNYQNMFLYIHGLGGDIIEKLKADYTSKSTPIEIIFESDEPKYISDAYIVKSAYKNYFQGCLSLKKIEMEENRSKELAIMSILSHRFFQNSFNITLSQRSISIIYNERRKYGEKEEFLLEIQESDLAEARKILKDSLDNIFLKPEELVYTVGQLLFSNVNFFEVYHTIINIDMLSINQYINVSKYTISESVLIHEEREFEDVY